MMAKTWTKVCEHCGDAFTRPAWQTGSFCSRLCSNASRKQARAITPCEHCGTSFEHLPRESRRFCSPECFAANAERGVCATCGKTYVAPRNSSSFKKFCSPKCHSKQPHIRSRVLANKQARRAAKFTNGIVPQIDPHEIFDRDGWRCYICGIDTPVSLAGTLSLQAPTLDHIIPITRDGSHDHSNLACCCLSCNSSKRDKTFDEYMEYRSRRASAIGAGQP